MTETLCWYCQNACGNCSWSKYFQPVNGWLAKPRIIYYSSEDKKIDSFLVIKCPLFISDSKYSRITTQELSKKLGFSTRTLFRKSDKDLIKMCKKNNYKHTKKKDYNKKIYLLEI